MIVINSVSEYLDYINTIESLAYSTPHLGCFNMYRGQANSNWGIMPSLYREGLFDEESLMLRELKHMCPEEFNGNRFATLVKMQHYGMPTRLLDTTTNPLVALYFACENETEMNSNGAVYVFPNLPASWSTDPRLEVIMEYVFENWSYRVCLDNMLDIFIENNMKRAFCSKDDSIKHLLHELTIPFWAVMPAKTNERIEDQNGAFLLFGMKIKNRIVSTNPGTLNRVYYDFEPIDSLLPEQISQKAKTLVIPASAKKDILKQLDVIGINEYKLFPDLTHQIKHAIKFAKEYMLRPYKG